MFKPAEEMVYIGLDEQSRTKGKAAIDVAGAQTGKSIGSVLQQVHLLQPHQAILHIEALRSREWQIAHPADCQSPSRCSNEADSLL